MEVNIRMTKQSSLLYLSAIYNTDNTHCICLLFFCRSYTKSNRAEFLDANNGLLYISINTPCRVCVRGGKERKKEREKNKVYKQ